MSALYLPKTTKRRSSALMSLAAVASMLAVGGGNVITASAMEQPAPYSQHQSGQDMSGHSQAATDLRVGLNNLLAEHVTSSLNVTRAIASQAPQRNIDGAVEAQYANADALAAAVGSVYGGEAQAQFAGLFREHIVASNQYAMAVAVGDEAGKQAANAELREYLNELSSFFSSATGLPMQDVYGLLNEHEELINKSTDAYKAGDYVQSYQMEREALKQVGRIADALTGGIVMSLPERF